MLLLSLGALLLCGAELYKWVDENGVVHYSETPPQDRAAATIELAPAPVAPAVADESPGRDSPQAPGSAWYEQWLEQQQERKKLEKQRRDEKSLSRAHPRDRLPGILRRTGRTAREVSARGHLGVQG